MTDSDIVDVGDAIELTFAAAPGSDVRAWWIPYGGTPVMDGVAVTETPAASGKFPKTFVPTLPGLWQAKFEASGASTAVEVYWVRAEAIDGPPPLALVGDVTGLEILYSVEADPAAVNSLVRTLIRQASALLRYRIPDLDARIASGTVPASIAAHAVVNMIMRVMRNPRALRSQTVGPFTRSFSPTAASALLEVTQGEVDLLTPAADTTDGHQYAGTIIAQPGMLRPPHGIRRGPLW